MSKKAISLLSGGLDSTVLAYYLKNEGYQLRLLSVDYNQKHKKELEFAYATAKRLGAEWYRIDLTSINQLIATSALTSKEIDVPNGHYAEETMKKTLVPNRNAFLLSLAWASAISWDAELVAFGCHNGDRAIYEDCRPEFVTRLNTALKSGSASYSNPDLHIETPFIFNSKADIVKIGHSLNVPFELTWSCYRGEDVHDGTCSTCVERQQSFDLAGVYDPTEYRDSTSWRKVVEEFESRNS